MESVYNIYPEEFQPNKEYVDPRTNFLDLLTVINNGIFSTSLFDERDHFGFKITRFPYRDSLIPFKMFYSSIAAESLHICRASSKSDSATTSIQALVSGIVKQGADVIKMKDSIMKMFNRHHIPPKYGMQNNELLKCIFI